MLQNIIQDIDIQRQSPNSRYRNRLEANIKQIWLNQLVLKKLSSILLKQRFAIEN